METGGKPNGGWGQGRDQKGRVVGRFQFRTKALIDIGMMNGPGEWTGWSWFKKYAKRVESSTSRDNR